MGSKKQVSAMPSMRKTGGRETLTLDVAEVLAWLDEPRRKRGKRQLFHLGACVLYACLRRADSSSKFDEEAVAMTAARGFDENERKELLAFLVAELGGGAS